MPILCRSNNVAPYMQHICKIVYFKYELNQMSGMVLDNKVALYQICIVLHNKSFTCLLKH